MEIKIGVQEVPRELVIETSTSAADVEKAFKKALADGGVFEVSDDKGRRLLVPATHIAYLDLGQEHARTVGFGAV